MTEQARPDYEWVIDQLRERETVLNSMHTEMCTDEDWFDAGSSDTAKLVIVPKLKGLPKKGWDARYISLHYLGVMVGVNQIHVGESLDVRWVLPDGDYHDPKNPKKSSDEVKKARERKIGSWLKGAVYTHDTFTPDSLIRELVIKLIALGMGCVSYSIDYDRWPDPPFGWVYTGKTREAKEPRANSKAQKEQFAQWKARRARSFPFTLENVHPTVLFMDPFSSIPFDYIRREQIKRGAAERILPELAERQQAGRSGATCERITYVSPYWIGQWIDGVPLPSEGAVDGVKPNKSGLPLHRMAFGGFGSNNRYGDFVTKGQGLIRPARDLVVQKIVLMNVIARIQAMTAFQPLQVKGPDPSERQRIMDDLSYEPGATIDLPDDYSIKEFPEIKVSQAIFQLNDLTDQLLARVYGPEITEGIRSPGETSTGQRQRQSIASSVYRAAKQAGQQLMAAVFMDMLSLVKYELQEECPVMGGDGTIVSVGPDDIDDGGMALVNFSAPSPDELAQKLEGLEKELTLGLKSPQDVLEEMGDEDPEGHVLAVRVQAEVDAILKSDMYLQNLLDKLGLMAPAAPIGAPPAAATTSGQPLLATASSNGVVPQVSGTSMPTG